MKQLDPRALWLFAAQNTIGTIIFGVIISVSILPLLLIENGGSGILVLLLCCVVLIGFIALGYFWAVLTYNNIKYELTEDGFKKEQGVIFKHYVTIPYDRIQNVDIYRGLVARIIGLSDLHIQTAGFSFTGQYAGASSEGRLPGLSPQVAEELRDELVKRAKTKRSNP